MAVSVENRRIALSDHSGVWLRSDGTAWLWGTDLVTPLSPPTGLKAVRNAAYTEVVLTCDAHADATHYRWSRATGLRGTWTQIAETEDPTYTDSGLTASDAHHYSVSAYDENTPATGLRCPAVYVPRKNELS